MARPPHLFLVFWLLLSGGCRGWAATLTTLCGELVSVVTSLSSMVAQTSHETMTYRVDATWIPLHHVVCTVGAVPGIMAFATTHVAHRTYRSRSTCPFAVATLTSTCRLFSTLQRWGCYCGKTYALCCWRGRIDGG